MNVNVNVNVCEVEVPTMKIPIWTIKHIYSLTRCLPRLLFALSIQLRIVAVSVAFHSRILCLSLLFVFCSIPPLTHSLHLACSCEPLNYIPSGCMCKAFKIHCLFSVAVVKSTMETVHHRYIHSPKVIVWVMWKTYKMEIMEPKWALKVTPKNIEPPLKSSNMYSPICPAYM